MTNLRCQVIGLAGQIGAGKSSIARGLAEALDWKVGSFGEYVRDVATESGFEHTRDNLQAVGEDLIQTLSADEFIHRVVSASGWDGASGLIIEGIRHQHIAEALPQFFRPSAYALVFVSAPRELRELRLKQRDGSSTSEIVRAERHSTELEIATRVRGLADTVFPATADVPAAVSGILRGKRPTSDVVAVRIAGSQPVSGPRGESAKFSFQSRGVSSETPA
ncbi:MAG: AAA family ATPase [bacterium]|nr:AAA family ATPase [bacterium]